MPDHPPSPPRDGLPADTSLFSLAGRTAVVTGASRGLGLQLARALARAGADLVITARAVESLAASCRELEAFGRRVLPLALDVGSAASIAEAAAAALDAGPVDILVNNAGCNVRKPALEVTWDDWNLVLDTNLRGTFFLSQALARHMVSRGRGRIITIGSITSQFGFGGLAPYTASRGGIRQLTMSLAAALGPHGITVNCLAPGWFRTAQNDVLYRDESWVRTIVDRTPLGRTGGPGDLDGAVVFLASDASGFVTGQTLMVDGGFTTGSTRATPAAAPAVADAGA